MAAPSRADVEEMIVTALAEFEQRVETHMQAMQTEQVFVVDAQANLKALANGTRQEFVNFQSRNEQLIISNNSTFDEHKAALQKFVVNLQQAGVDGARIAMALEGNKQLNESNLNMRKDIERYALELRTLIEKVTLDSTSQIAAVKAEASSWAKKFKKSMVGLLEAGAGFWESGGKGGGKY